MKKRRIILIISIILITIITIIFFKEFKKTSSYCNLRNGRISNTIDIIDYYDEIPIYGTVCHENETNMGPVKGLRCDCICCIPK